MKTLATLASLVLTASPALARDFRARLPWDEVIYFVLPDRFENGDRGGLTGGPMRTGFDPTRKGFYHGGNLKGLVKRLPYGTNADFKTLVDAAHARGIKVYTDINTSDTPVSEAVQVEVASDRFRPLARSCATRAAAPASVTVSLPAFGYAACAADAR